ncbi:MoaF N-terminal domain-containing protein [Streptomyces sp. NPDC048527]|uniref:MoaF-related domain-containing protein n=1 Tax=Streptomyces sp. NPDC048527 TaxID=3365568 RepID=UPI0037165AB0
MTGTVPLPSPQPDRIGGPSTTELAGVVMEYRYSTGNHYRMEFAADRLTFHLLSDPAGHTRTLPYRARKLHDDLFLVCWIVKPGIHVALVVDFTRDRIHVTGMMPPNQWEFFDIGDILDVRRGDTEQG